MLRFSRATGDAAWLNLNVVAEKVVLLIKKRARDQKVIIERRLDEDLPDTCGDPWQLEQVALNLVLNGLQAMPRGGTLRLQSGASAEEVWLEVRDTGQGIPAEVLARLFTPFLTTRGEEGTGLGLAISKRIVEEHRGQLTLENLEPGVLARVALPLKRPVDGQGPRVDTGGGGAGPAGRGGDGAQGPDNRG
jgi:signal transduction histidine kinase